MIFSAMVAMLGEDDRAFMLDLYKNYYNLARKNIFSLTHSEEDMEDLISDAFVKLMEKVSLLRTLECCRLTAYIVYTIRSVSINYLRHKAVETKHICYDVNFNMADDLPETGDELDDRLIRQEEVELLGRVISMLPQNQKDLLYFKYLLDLSDSEIAGLIGVSPDSVRQYLTRARRSAKRLMEREMIGHAES